MKDFILARRVFTGGKALTNQRILLQNGKISGLEEWDGFSTGETVYENVSAGFIDIHINGGAEFYFTGKPDEETIQDIVNASAEGGAAYVLPTLITSPLENIRAGVSAIRNFRQRNPGGAVIGMHLEGPYLNPAKRGAHLEKFIRNPDEAELEELIEFAEGDIRLITIAPERFSTTQLQLLLDSEIQVAAGHSNATYAEAMDAFGKGIRLVTHLYNAMSSFQHREPGLVGATFDSDEVFAPIIADGFHCDFGAVSIASKVKREKLFLISDALFLGRRKEQFEWGGFGAFLQGKAYRNSESNLAGGAIDMGETVYNAVNLVGIPLVDVIDMVTRRPSAALGLSAEFGDVRPGYPAVFTTFNDRLTSFSVLRN